MSATAQATDPVRRRAVFYAPEVAFNRPVPPVAPKVFRDERARVFAPDQPTGVILLDQGPALGCPWPATTPTMLARYVVLHAGGQLTLTHASDGDIYYVIRGRGRTQSAGERLSWAAGDVFVLPGGVPAEHEAQDGAILLLCNNEPQLSYLRAMPSNAALIAPTLFAGEESAVHLRAVHARNEPQRAAGKSVVFVTEPMAARRVTTPTMLAALNTLEPGGAQRAHKHSSAALSLAIKSEGVYSMVDGARVDWEPDTLFVTPPGAVHSHHNDGMGMMESFVVQDTGLHTELRTTNFAWTD